MNPLPLSIRDLMEGLAHLIETEDASGKKGLFQALNPAVRVLSVFSLIIGSLFARDPALLLALCAVPISIAILSGVPMKMYLVRATAFIPLFAGIITLPVIFLTDGSPIASGEILSFQITATEEGLLRFMTFTMRVWFCVASLMLLIMTMGINSIMSTMSYLKAPPVFVQVLALTYRYLVLSVVSTQRMLFAKEARTFSKGSRISLNSIRSLGSVLAVLFIRAYDRSERVYLAMVARGFSPFRPSQVNREGMGLKDLAFIIFLSLVFVLIAASNLI